MCVVIDLFSKTSNVHVSDLVENFSYVSKKQLKSKKMSLLQASTTSDNRTPFVHTSKSPIVMNKSNALFARIFNSGRQNSESCVHNDAIDLTQNVAHSMASDSSTIIPRETTEGELCESLTS